jgi:hypothetical protein
MSISYTYDPDHTRQHSECSAAHQNLCDVRAEFETMLCNHR